jgi:VWFA-related protein
MTDTRTSIAGAVAMVLVASAVLLAQQSRLRFQSGVEVIPVDVTVVDDRGVAVSNLGPDDFIVRVDGAPRRVLTAERVSDKAKSRASWAVAVPEGYSSNEESTDGRLIVLAVDLPNVRPGGGQGLMTAVEAFIDRLSPADKIAVVGLGGGAGGPGTGFTADHEQVKQAIARMKGQAVQNAGQKSEALRAMARCQSGFIFGGLSPAAIARANEGMADCRSLLIDSAGTLAGSGVNSVIQRLRDLLAGLRTIDGPKTLVLLSEGFIAKNRLTVAGDVGTPAAAARTTVFILGLEEALFEAHGTRWPVPPEGDQWQRMQQLSVVADAARGAFFGVSGSGSEAFKRIEADLSGYYLLSVESTPGDRDGTSHEIRVHVARRDVTVRAQQQIPKAATGTGSRSPKEAVIAGLGAPLRLSTLPLRVTAFAMKARDPSQIYMAVHADVGTGYTTPTSVSIGPRVTDGEGQVVRAALTDMKLSPKAKGAVAVAGACPIVGLLLTWRVERERRRL